MAQITEEIKKQIVDLAQMRDKAGHPVYQYHEIATLVGNDVTRWDISTVCIDAGYYRRHPNVNGNGKIESEEKIRARIAEMHNKIKADQLKLQELQHRVQVTWTLTGKKFLVEINNKSDKEVMNAVKHFLNVAKTTGAKA